MKVGQAVAGAVITAILAVSFWFASSRHGHRDDSNKFERELCEWAN